jgi:hypothetical protein
VSLSGFVLETFFGVDSRWSSPKFRESVVLRSGADARWRRVTPRKKGACGESRGGSEKGETSESYNPMDGYGMKQGRGSVSGAKRHEVEKACRRCTAGSGKPGVGRCSHFETSKGRKPHGRAES